MSIGSRWALESCKIEKSGGVAATTPQRSGAATSNAQRAGDAGVVATVRQLPDRVCFRNSQAFYFLPSENEWYKAAYHQNDGVTANYWDYATGSDTAPTAVASGQWPVASGTTAGTAVYNVQVGPADVSSAGGLSPYGTMGQNGNVWEWSESGLTAPNDSSSEIRAFRGGYWFGT